MNAPTSDPIPAVCFLADVCKHLRLSPATLHRLRRAGAFPIPEMPSLDKHPRWRGADIAKYLETPEAFSRRPWGKRA